MKDVWKSYFLGKVQVDALKGVNLSIQKGDFAAVAGPSGSGKTTIMNIVGLIDTPSSGGLFIEGKEVGGLNRNELTRMRQEVLGFVFQSFNLMPVLTVFENVELPLLLGRKNGKNGGNDKNDKTNSLNKKQRKEWVEHLLDSVGLAERRGHLPSELSGGQQQRVAIARSLVNRPKIVIADEPTANLDSENGRRVLDLMKSLNSQDGTTFIFSTHDHTIWEMANHIIFLQDGKIKKEEHIK